MTIDVKIRSLAASVAVYGLGYLTETIFVPCAGVVGWVPPSAELMLGGPIELPFGKAGR